MKKILVTLSLFIYLFGISSVDAQVVDVPKKSKDHFFKKYANAKNADWNNNVVNYAVKFNLNDATCRAYYHLDGSWHYTDTYMDAAQLPTAVRESFSKSRFADWKTDAVALVENNKGKKTYRIEVKKGIENHSIYYDINGKEVKSNPTL